MQTKDIIDNTLRISKPFAEQRGLTIWDVSFEKEGGGYVLTVYLDGENGVSIDDCEAVSRGIDPILDKEDYIDCAYTLCVSSAGLTRKLTREEHFEKLKGSKIEVHLFSPINKSKVYVGILRKYENGDVTIQTSDEEMTFEKDRISCCRMFFEV